MRTPLMAALLMLAGGASVAQDQPAAQVEVRFEQPQDYRDARLRGPGPARGADADVIEALTKHLRQLGQRYLTPGQRLRIEIRDIDLAGRFEPWHGPGYEVRFMRDITWPSIDLYYTFEQPGQASIQAADRVSDKSYLSRPGRQASSDRLYAEKAMLTDWFRQRFASPPAS
ncbi:DUF3016 domain-containing protein [Pseudomonas fulva]|nr:DUF3016 domain-containing protein [Pseudomonas fulva]MBF8780409.1 DUF3016 domain-containing protein [Pseudomonas fulva]